MKTFGLTGGIGTGKSTAAGCLKQRGIIVIDTDDVARQVVEPGQPALDEIRKEFGPDMVRGDGSLDREQLARVVFGNDLARKKLEAILHPRIRAVWQAEVERWRGNGTALGVVIIPLLFETGAQGNFDATICLACSPATQNSRLAARGWSEAQVRQRIEAQWPLEKKMQAATHVLWTEGSVEALADQLQKVIG